MMPRLLLMGLCLLAPSPAGAADAPPNVILCMADDLGWGDTGYNGNPVIRTPHLDAMAAQGVRFDRFYSASAVCSPTRASVMTGRHPHRTGVFHANVGVLRPEEFTIAEYLSAHGYATGHFGKWHLGTFSKSVRDANRGGSKYPELYNPPGLHGFDTWFSTESKVPTWDPMRKPARFDPEESGRSGWRAIREGRETAPYGTAYWTPHGRATDNLDGDDSRVIMDRALPFIRAAVQRRQPFFAVIWFHAPHLPCVAGPEYAALYQDQPFLMQQYAGCITALDDQIGRLRKELDALGVAGNTLLCFTSDNGPEERTPGSTGGLSGRKRSLKEGGIRVPGLMVWPNRYPQPLRTQLPASTSDYFPTIQAAVGAASPPASPPLDGRNILPLLDDPCAPEPNTAFMIDRQAALVGPRFKLRIDDLGTPDAAHLFDLTNDPGEQHNLADKHPQDVDVMRLTLDAWIASCAASFNGAEYGDDPLRRVPQSWPPDHLHPTATDR